MTAHLLTFFSCGSPALKTSFVYHLGCLFAQAGKKTLLVDLTPHAQLTATFLPEAEHEHLYYIHIHKQLRATIYGALYPLMQGSNLADLLPYPSFQKIGNHLFFLPGDPLVTSYEDILSHAWFNYFSGHDPLRALSILMAARRIILTAARGVGAELVLIVAGDYLNALARLALIASDYLILVLRQDIVSMRAMQAFGGSLASFQQSFARILTEHQRSPVGQSWPWWPQDIVRPIGYVCEQPLLTPVPPASLYALPSERLDQAYQHNIVRCDGQSAESLGHHAYCLAQLDHYAGLNVVAEMRRKAIFDLTPADGALSAEQAAHVRQAKHDFTVLAQAIEKRITSF